MNILLIFATNSGATDMASQIIADVLTSKGATVTRKPVRDTKPDEIGSFDAVVVGSPSWDFNGQEGMPHEDFIAFMEEMKTKSFEGKPFAVFGLGDSSYTHFCGAVGHLEEMVKGSKGNLITESLKIDGFYYKQAENTDHCKAWAEKVAAALMPAK